MQFCAYCLTSEPPVTIVHGFPACRACAPIIETRSEQHAANTRVIVAGERAKRQATTRE
jgi:hypothetical protein